MQIVINSHQIKYSYLKRPRKQYLAIKMPIGQMLKYGNMNYTVSGLFRDLPSNTHLPIELISLRPLDWKFTYEQENSWGYNLFDYYLWVPAHSKVTDIESTIKNIYLSAHPYYKNASQKEKDKVSFKLEPITDIHLYIRSTQMGQ